ncbi:MAG: hypothetical protein WAL83_16350 [Arenicellales bacterium]|jgi:hypothetical protein
MATAETIDTTEAADEEPVKFTESEQCKSFRFCKTCRDTGTVGKLWRRVVAKRFIVPSNDWKCPHGWKWGGEPGLILKLKQKFNPGSKFGRTTSAVGIKPCGGCAKRAAKMDGRQA